MTHFVRYDRDPRGAVTITIDRPERRNALSTEVLEELLAAFARADEDEKARAIVLTGAGEQAFSAGGDLEKFLQERADAPGVQAQRFVDLFTAMGRHRLPIVGRINGHCLAGAFGLALACDLLVAVEDATFGTPEILVGLWPMMIGALIRRNLPRKLANELMLTGRRLSAREAHEAGIVNRVVPAVELDGVVHEWIAALVAHPASIIAMGRRAVFAEQDMPFVDGLAYLREQLVAVLEEDDAVEGIRAFLEKRPPKFRNS